MTRPSLSRHAYLLALAIVIGLKLWLVHGEEIAGSATQYDALWYIRSASHWYWGTPYDWIAFIRPCAYPLWIALIQLIHLPLRLAIELLQLGGALILIFGLRSLGVSRLAGLLSFSLICLHPIAYQENDYSMSDTFYAAMLWLVLGGLLFVLARPGFWQAFGTGVAIAILWNTREEGLLLFLLLALTTIFAFYIRRFSLPGLHRSQNYRTIIVVWLTATTLILSVYTVNRSVFGSFARSEMTAPVFQSLYHSLLRIKPAEPKPYAPITTDTIQRAFAVSPTFAKLRAPLTGPLGESWRVETYRRTGTANEIGVGWIVWATRQAAAAEGYFSSSKAARRFFTKAAEEIKRACDTGRLPTRFVLDGFLDPFSQSGAGGRLPASALRVGARVFGQWNIVGISDDTILTKEEAALYDRMTWRRSAGTLPRQGLAVSVEKTIGRFHWLVMVLLHILAGVALVSLLVSRRRLANQSGILLGITLLTTAIFLRGSLLFWLDATAFDATQDRFLLPILPLWSAVLILVIFIGLAPRSGVSRT
ncbi:MAG: hypothetical protein ACR2G0_06895 [Chthoniobacterales bacterium]